MRQIGLRNYMKKGIRKMRSNDLLFSEARFWREQHTKFWYKVAPLLVKSGKALTVEDALKITK